MANMNGIDISSNDGQINWGELAGQCTYCYIKASEGTTYQDPSLEENYNGAISIGLKVGFYHFLVGSSEPETQAENFYNCLKDKRSDLKPCLDIEREGFDVMDYALRFINRFNELSGGSLPIVIYSAPYFINEHLDGRLAQYPLWVANYGVETPMGNDVWENNYVGHQFSETGRINGISTNVDLNNFSEGVLLGSVYNGQAQPVLQPQVNTDTRVLELQRLINQILGVGISEDNIWGSETEGQVHDLPLCGIDYIQRNLTKWVQLRLGFTGEDVDGIYYTNTANSVGEWQRNHGLTDDMVVGFFTYKSLALD